MFGVSLTVHRDYSGLGAELLKVGRQVLSSHNKKGLFIGSRVPNFRAESKGYSIEQWVYGAHARSFDRMIAFFQENGFSIVRIIADYFDEPHSCNYGVLMYCGASR